MRTLACGVRAARFCEVRAEILGDESIRLSLIGVFTLATLLLGSFTRSLRPTTLVVFSFVSAVISLSRGSSTTLKTDFLAEFDDEILCNILHFPGAYVCEKARTAAEDAITFVVRPPVFTVPFKEDPDGDHSRQDEDLDRGDGHLGGISEDNE